MITVPYNLQKLSDQRRSKSGEALAQRAGTINMQNPPRRS